MPKQEAAGLPWPAQAARRQTTRQSDPAIRDSSAYRQKPADDTERTTSATAQSELDAAKSKLATLQNGWATCAEPRFRCVARSEAPRKQPWSGWNSMPKNP